MPIALIPVEQKRPLDATPLKILRLREAGMSVVELAAHYGLHRNRIYQLLAKARREQARVKLTQSPGA